MDASILSQLMAIRNRPIYKNDLFQPFINDYFTHPTLIKRFPQFKILNFYFFDYNKTFDFIKSNQVKKYMSCAIKNDPKKYKDICQKVFYDISLFIGFRRLNGKGSLPFFITLRKDYNEDQLYLAGFSTYDPNVSYMTKDHTFNLKDDLLIHSINDMNVTYDSYDHELVGEILKIGKRSNLKFL